MASLDTWQEEARRLIATGASLNSVARLLNVPRATVQRLARTLGVKQTVTEEARALAKIRHEKLSGNLEKALQDAYAMKTLAESKMDTRMLLAANRAILRILAMQAKQTPRIPGVTETSITAKPNYRRGCRILAPDISDFPGDLAPIFERFFSPKEMASRENGQKNLPAGVPVVRLQIVWAESPVSPEGLAN